MNIIRWDHYDYDNENNSQKEYREIDDPNPQETYMNLCDEIRKHGYRFDGPYHQNGKMGTPVAEGDLYMTFSYRSWGQVMADAWSSVDKICYNYMDFYMMDSYLDDFKTPEYDLPGFVKPERPIQTSPNNFLDKLSVASAVRAVMSSITGLTGAVEKLRNEVIGNNNALLNKDTPFNAKLRLNELVSNMQAMEEKYMRALKVQEDFYKEHPEYNPEKIATLVSADGSKTVRVYGPYAHLTYEKVMKQYPVETCTDNQLEQVFPDWNRCQKTFDEV